MATDILGESFREVVQIGSQSVFGTAVAATIPEPVDPGSFNADEDFEQILDEGRRSLDVKDFAAYQGVGKTEISWSGQGRDGSAAIPAALHVLLVNILSSDSYSVNAVDGSSTPYEHRFRAGTTRKFLTIEHKQLGDALDREFKDCRVTELVVKWNSGEGTLDYTVTLTGQGATVAASTDLSATPGIPDIGVPHLGWEAGVIVNNIGSWTTATGLVAGWTRLISAEWTFRRSPPELFYSGQNQKTFADMYLPPLEVLCNMVIGYNEDSTAVDDASQMPTAFRAKNQALCLNSFQTGDDDASTNSRRIGFAANKMDLGDGPMKFDTSGPSTKLALVGRALYSDAAGTFTSEGNTNVVTAALSMKSPVEISIITPYATTLVS